jgi:hypothetical protein
MPIAICSVPALADCISPIALCGVGRYILRSITNSGPVPQEAEKSMRAEVERLVEEIKQSVGLLRRHL